MLFQTTSPRSDHILGSVKDNLEKEAQEIDMMKFNMTAGSRLLKEKERKLKQLETSLLDADLVSVTNFTLFITK